MITILTTTAISIYLFLGLISVLAFGVFAWDDPNGTLIKKTMFLVGCFFIGPFFLLRAAIDGIYSNFRS